jgi:hypothetical protein
MEFFDRGEEAVQDVGNQGESDEFGAATDERIHAHGRCGKSGVEIHLVKLEAELHPRARSEKRLPDQGNGAIESWSGRKRAAVSDIEFLEDGKASGTEVVLEFAKGVDGIGIVHEDQTANHGVEGFVKGHFGGIALDEANVAHAPELRAGNGPLNGRRDAVAADNFTAGTDEIGDEEGDITSAAPDVENAHARGNAGLEKKLAGEGLVSLRLAAESMEFLL